MEVLKQLEQKIVILVNKVKQLQQDNDLLMEKNLSLELELEKLYCTQKSDVELYDSLAKEKEETRFIVDSLIKSIDAFVEQERK